MSSFFCPTQGLRNSFTAWHISIVHSHLLLSSIPVQDTPNLFINSTISGSLGSFQLCDIMINSTVNVCCLLFCGPKFSFFLGKQLGLNCWTTEEETSELFLQVEALFYIPTGNVWDLSKIHFSTSKGQMLSLEAWDTISMIRQVSKKQKQNNKWTHKQKHDATYQPSQLSACLLLSLERLDFVSFTDSFFRCYSTCEFRFKPSSFSALSSEDGSSSSRTLKTIYAHNSQIYIISPDLTFEFQTFLSSCLLASPSKCFIDISNFVSSIRNSWSTSLPTHSSLSLSCLTHLYPKNSSSITSSQSYRS